MASWKAVQAAEPDFAERVEALFGAGRHKTLATLRRDGAPRISGIEATFAAGELWLGMMPRSRKGQDLRRDPRMALHSPSLDPPADPTAWGGDAKVSGRAIEETGDEQRRAFRRAQGGSWPQASTTSSRVPWPRTSARATSPRAPRFRPAPARERASRRRSRA